ncbi:MAG: long-chain-fatty-acid--CoA ligase [Conexibacter sp.]|nr:long-chain-fatty-acid--CoA ligase [Conexibacter sp.]
MTPTSIASIIDANAASYGDRLALVDGERRYTHRELLERCRDLAAGLAGHGLRRGDRLAVLLQNQAELIELLYATARLGVVLVPLNYRLAPAEIRDVLLDCAAATLVVGDGYAQQLDEMIEGLTSAPEVFFTDANPPTGGRPLDDLRRGDLPAPPTAFDDADPLALIYTGGTTGRPKGVVITHGGLTASVARESAHLGFRPDDVSLCAIPLFHVSIVHMLSVAWAGGSAILMSKIESQALLEAIERHGVTHTTLIPTSIGDLLAHPAIGDYRLSTLRMLVYGGAPIPPETLERTIETFGEVLVQVYGLTEASGVVSVLAPEDHRLEGETAGRLRSAGRPLPGLAIEIRQGDGTLAPTGHEGEIVVLGSGLMGGYWQRPEETAEALHDGALATGDVGRLDDDGFLYVVDRKKEMIISGGENVYPKEVEDAIGHHPLVAEVAVVGVPHPRWGEAVKAYVVPRPGSVLTESDVIEHCRGLLARYKTPREVELCDSLPRTSVGKVDKNRLRARSSQMAASPTPGTSRV